MARLFKKPNEKLYFYKNSNTLKVYELIEKSASGLTSPELVELTGLTKKQVTGRLKELERGGHIYKNGKRLNLETLRTSFLWSCTKW